ncbi:MAG: type II toxin-antitoxin system PemK/MazF family toxin [Candidatus Pacebacteria bacterium]|nr:type II toxin-antitoxin system PemK/MazF family toxin [Candidatus Paceibacterota bacterium]
MKKENKKIIHPREGDIVLFGHDVSGKNRPAINLEPYFLHENKDSFNGVLTTTQKIDDIYPHDYPLFHNEDLEKPSKVICDQPTRIFKNSIQKKIGKISKKDLEEIRKRTAESLGIKYSDTTS